MRKVLFRAGGMVITFILLLLLLGVILGATGFSDKMLRSTINEELRGVRQTLAQSIRDPNDLERVLAAKKKELEEVHGLNTPWYQRLPQNIYSVVKLDLGESKTLRSFSGSSKISTIILERIPNTLLLMLTSFVIVSIVGIVAGVWSATHAGGKIDKLLSFFAIGTNALPAWWLGILLISLFAIKLNLLPSSGMYSAPPPEGGLPRFFDLIKHAVLPVISLTLVSIGPYIYTIRQVTIKVAQEPFVAFARARGLSEWRVRSRYILRVASPTIITGLVLGLVGSFSGAILTETVFNWPGMGRLYADAMLGTPDIGIIVALTVIYAALYLVARFLLDICYILLDPRVRY